MVTTSSSSASWGFILYRDLGSASQADGCTCCLPLCSWNQYLSWAWIADTHPHRTLIQPATQAATDKALPSAAPTYRTCIKHKYRQPRSLPPLWLLKIEIHWWKHKCTTLDSQANACSWALKYCHGPSSAFYTPFWPFLPSILPLHFCPAVCIVLLTPFPLRPLVCVLACCKVWVWLLFLGGQQGCFLLLSLLCWSVRFVSLGIAFLLPLFACYPLPHWKDLWSNDLWSTSST